MFLWFKSIQNLKIIVTYLKNTWYGMKVHVEYNEDYVTKIQ